MEKYYDNIIIPVDFGDRTEMLVHQAYSLAELMNTGLTLIHVNNSKVSLSYEKQKSNASYVNDDNDAETKLRRLAGLYSNKFNIPVQHTILEGEVHASITQFVEENRIRLIVMGKSGKSHGYENAIGKNTAQIIRMSTCPVITINQDVRESFSKILLPLDLSKQIRQKINIATMFSRYYGSTIKIISIINQDNFNQEKDIKTKLLKTKEFMIENNVACTTDMVYNFDRSSLTAERILKYSKESRCDMIMIMTQQEKNWKHTFIGSTASQIIKNSVVPVMSITPYQDNFKHI
ncbi:MAG: universal stress protein [Bacteroidales bacterium]|nr:universal stress protein [Bacteroidales bacterium]